MFIYFLQTFGIFINVTDESAPILQLCVIFLVLGILSR